MTWWRWRRKLEQIEADIRAAELLRDRAQQQQRRAEALVPRVDGVVRKLRVVAPRAAIRSGE